MDIVVTPRRRGWLRPLRLVLAVSALVAVVALAPRALGYQVHVVGDDAMAGTHARGSLVFDQLVLATRVEVDDVVTLRPPGADRVVTRRVVAVDEGAYWVRGDAVPDSVAPTRMLFEGTPPARVAFGIPVVGYPLLALDSLSLPTWTPGALVLGSAGLWLLLQRSRTRTAGVAPASGERPATAPRPSAAPPAA